MIREYLFIIKSTYNENAVIVLIVAVAQFHQNPRAKGAKDKQLSRNSNRKQLKR